ncbi:TniQ family protein [Acidithiobacillus ferrooxidans]|uniref:TniQ family protein n=1 Tax=Acidithiobacillus ferrooxidans TaxID=920 RepID=UPI003D18C6AC
MIAFFPEPYPDELLYSICARYHIMSRNNDFRHTVEDLFGCRQACAVYDFPSRLAALCAQLE